MQRETPPPAGTPSDRLLGPLIDAHACGDCVACCQVLKIDEPELQKPANTLCSHCTGSGCVIYETRPPVCRAWNCAWRRLADMPDAYRPDRLGVMFALDRVTPPASVFENAFIVGRALHGSDAYRTTDAKRAFGLLARRPLPVFANVDGVNFLVWPQQPLADAILNPATTRRQDLVPRGRAWLAAYAPIARAVAGPQACLPQGV